MKTLAEELKAEVRKARPVSMDLEARFNGLGAKVDQLLSEQKLHMGVSDTTQHCLSLFMEFKGCVDNRDAKEVKGLLKHESWEATQNFFRLATNRRLLRKIDWPKDEKALHDQVKGQFKKFR